MMEMNPSEVLETFDETDDESELEEDMVSFNSSLCVDYSLMCLHLLLYHSQLSDAPDEYEEEDSDMGDEGEIPNEVCSTSPCHSVCV